MGKSVVIATTKQKLAMLDKVLNFPRAVTQSNKSVNVICANLARDCSYQLPDIDELLEGLRNNGDLIESWVEYSNNKRSTPSWYFLKQGQKYKIGYISPTRTYDVGSYTEPSFACALFIKLELESQFSKLGRFDRV